MLRVDIILGSTRLGRNGEDQYPIDFWVFNTGLSIKLAKTPYIYPIIQIMSAF